MRASRVLLRAFVAVAVLAAVLVPAVIAPAHTISVPVTRARTVTFGDPVGGPAGWSEASRRVLFELPATHIGFSWAGVEGTGIRYRTIGADGDTSRWRRATEAHDMEAGDEHYSAVLSVDGSKGLEWKPVETLRHRVSNVTLDYIDSLHGPRESIAVDSIAEAAAGEPHIVTRAEWGADESLKSTSGGCERQFFPLQQLFVHHTAGSNFDTHPKATMRSVYWFHTERRGWCDIGYNFVIAPDGTIFEGRWARSYAPFEKHDSENRAGEVVAGAHVESYNSGSAGVSLMGNYSLVKPSPAMRRSLAELLAWEVDRHGLKPQAEHRYRNPQTSLTKRLPYIAGHRDAGDTECPGNYVYAALPSIRADVAAVVGNGKTTSSLTLQTMADRINYGEYATFTGTLLDESGIGLGRRSIYSYIKPAGMEWRAGPKTTTAPDGSFVLSLTPQRNVAVVAVYDGDETTWGASSEAVSVKVQPVVTLAPENGTFDAYGISHFPAGTSAVALSGDVSPAHVGGEIVLRVARVEADGSYTLLTTQTLGLNEASAYRYEFVLPKPYAGTYRSLAWFQGDTDHARASSPEIFFIVDP
ncbi:MAG: hypothetical protein QOG54_2238 [Actinomycetota bacterium]|jgi:hypothetical protein|nr:hypothetical protein [Actinomycetota bacterium]